ncbi:group III truncated hemoglobin [Yinghuangia sp. ASG 101]|uniref:group III truncated hemoglobin n=1 Tax=Yinghuangia sp. ASG 101 TaxID=2896848 RepID=UPI001E5C9F19|nr:group III truncated hemoglobin [Yinghuangia sp. ASG 101]UGQ10655.1 group III truncated hemoglobin [Yinghuangia sp. ASG 101]
MPDVPDDPAPPAPGAAPRPAVLRDIGSREDILLLLEDFYTAAFSDDLLGHVFVDVARMDLAEHLPRIADFWEVTLLRRGGYRGNALRPHQALHAQSPLTAGHFARWTRLWADTVRARFAGPAADRAVVQAERVAATMLKRLEIPDDGLRPWAPGPEGRTQLPLSG